MEPGIDVSHWDGLIDWARVAAAGVKFSYAKASEGSGYTDDTLGANIRGAAASGVLTGAYHFYRLAASPESQAQRFLDSIKGLPWDLPPSLDFEEETAQSQAEVARVLKRWADLVETGCGRRPIIYSSAYFWNTFVGSASASWANDYGLWVANYGSTIPMLPKVWNSWQFWQYSDKGRVSGISSDVDLDWFAGTEAELYALAGKEVPGPVEGKLLATVLVDRLRMRETPGGEIAGFMAPGSELEILETRSAGGITWGRFDGWMAIDPAYCKIKK